jgi:trehalose synthase
MPQEVEVPIRDTTRFREVMPPERYEAFLDAAEEARTRLAGRAVWNVNSTARGGGVVELLRPLVGYARGVGVDARWLVLDAGPAFYEVTKRIHNRLHGFEGDGGPLDDEARQIYEHILRRNVEEFAPRVRPGDVVILHDPQSAGMAPMLAPLTAALIWRCHVGVDEPNALARETWSFLQPYVRHADVCVFSRRKFVWDGLDAGRVAIITPTIDGFTPKNVDLTPEAALGILRASGLVADGVEAEPVTFTRQDGTPGRVERAARVIEDEPLQADTPIVLQISRWDALKDPLGVIRGFAEHVPAETGAHLVYAGPSVDAVADDPEGLEMLHDSIEARAALPADVRRRVHLATLPMEDLDENAVIVNALQRHARVVVQKSFAEGFGLTVAEAMWKGRPVVASRVGGIEEQIVDGVSGVLLDDAHDLAAFGRAVTDLLADPQRAEQIGRGARERVRDHFLSVQSLLDYQALIGRILEQRQRSSGSRLRRWLRKLHPRRSSTGS